MQEQIFVLNDRNAAMKAISYMDSIISGSSLYEAIIRPFTNKRSVQQNRLYWKWIGVMADYAGVDKDAMHEYCRDMFLQKRAVQIFGDETSYRISTTKLKVVEFTDYLQKIERFAERQNLNLPKPQAIYEYAINGTKPN